MPAPTGLPEAESHRVFGQAAGRRKTPFRASLYVRVSTHDQQTLREFAGRDGCTIVMRVSLQRCPSWRNSKSLPRATLSRILTNPTKTLPGDFCSPAIAARTSV